MVTVPLLKNYEENPYHRTPHDQVEVANKILKNPKETVDAVLKAKWDDNESALLIQLMPEEVGGWLRYGLAKCHMIPIEWYLKNADYQKLWKRLVKENYRPFIGLNHAPSTMPGITYAVPAIYCKNPE